MIGEMMPSLKWMEKTNTESESIRIPYGHDANQDECSKVLGSIFWFTSVLILNICLHLVLISFVDPISGGGSGSLSDVRSGIASETAEERR